MNYQELATTLNRPLSTVRKWRADIAKIRGYDFEQMKVWTGRGRKCRIAYYFSLEQVEKFKELNKLLQSGEGKEQAITQVFGSKEQEEKTLEEKMSTLAKVLQSQLKKNEEMEKQLIALTRKNNDLTDRVEALENKGLKSIFKK
ncbi:hypothetical protein [Enterococcus sp. BWR-S5]|uniref:hypothetical protein n=1 Tax=Enterococcus sp. BWR-S5 TaxID=2787714 RepID=UPI001924906D|nr:hypothetical protein [Enterococcus sp. BWR-S5]MBL1223911.1 hypothetical protein [Enterococcus sp. BWR-S5]